MDKIIDYFVTEKKKSPKVAGILAKKLCKYDDIKEEFIYWLNNRILKDDSPIEVEGYTAKKLSEIQPEFEVSGLYSFLVTLRDDPESAKETISRGFPRK